MDLLHPAAGIAHELHHVPDQARVQVAGYSQGIRAAAIQASGLSSRRTTVAANENPYAILGSTPGFVKPSRPRRAG